MSKKRAILSVYDKTNIDELAQFLVEQNFEIISSGGTYKLLNEKNIPVKKVSDITGFPEILNGRVKTLHPNIHGGILAKRDVDHLAQLNELGLSQIDLVVVNLYPFQETIAQEGVTFNEAIEQIDIGGPTMIRAAAKNHQYVTVLSNPNLYSTFIEEYKSNAGKISDEFRRKCAAEVFQTMAGYDSSIAEYLTSKDEISNQFGFSGSLQQKLRYGENPHQIAGLYKTSAKNPLGEMKQLHGKELSFNNLLDLQAALNINSEYTQPSCTIIKHNNPCGVGIGDSLAEAHKRARSTDEQSAFGGIIAVNRELDLTLAEDIASFFTECIVAPSFSKEALARLTKKKNLRLLTFNPEKFQKPAMDIKQLSGGFLLQSADTINVNIRESKIVTDRSPGEEEWHALDFVWKVIRHVKSNAIVFANHKQTLGIGAGQMSRVDSTEVAIQKAKKAGLSLKGSIVGSDAFFPFKDSIEALAEAGAKAIIQPGGSIRDEEVIEAANKAGIAMVFTGIRHFKH
ncbi:MAG: bifunctional phosphoribosylaminoimidazolecarboxamide formyltransferase/IMP cyclohydrolase PurH [Calditrichaeota bacterium]|nr:MAG: bifunctional phosphoribosylaminoimidazolecarboxamide formyltransferase/IMP cyclohydrolase PurH [Calditrichota bacterium]MBL1206569.1 bifunctional phosphoribosylaminoimidazolecarboxamide formyltransferase/IMP cyclohydrolase PurH [Calditrichota bacterium]NOG46396.1 bifunctional phosphoribosylaminoimidazolecarboxamide formyltransferase/IMP cyclohydrolase [Calditrichota bacterium]